jgi:hypothetical protein
VVVKWTNGVPIDVAKVVEAPPMPLETIGKGPGVWMGTSQVVTNQTKRVLPPAASGVCFKCGSGTNVVPMKVFKLEKDVGVPMLGGVNRISQGVLKCPKCGIRVAFTNQVWIPEEKMKAITK